MYHKQRLFAMLNCKLKYFLKSWDTKVNYQPLIGSINDDCEKTLGFTLYERRV